MIFVMNILTTQCPFYSHIPTSCSRHLAALIYASYLSSSSTSSCFNAIVPNQFYLFFPRLLWRTFFLFLTNLDFHYFKYLRVSVWIDDITIPPQTAMFSDIFNLDKNIHPFSRNSTWDSINQSYPTYNPN